MRDRKKKRKKNWIVNKENDLKHWDIEVKQD